MIDASVCSRADNFPIFIVNNILEIDEIFMTNDYENGVSIIVFYKGSDFKSHNFFFDPETESVKFVTRN